MLAYVFGCLLLTDVCCPPLRCLQAVKFVAHDGTGVCNLHVSVAEHSHGGAASAPAALTARSEAQLREADGGGNDDSSRAVGRCVSFRVQDNGCGISDEELGHVFEAFQQLKAGMAYKGAYLRVIGRCTNAARSVSRNFIT
jgi:hypothetical protein